MNTENILNISEFEILGDFITNTIETLAMIAYSEEKITQKEIVKLGNIDNLCGRCLWTKNQELIKREAEDILMTYFIKPTSWEKNKYFITQSLEYKN
jgi:hypothetical protein